MLRWFHTYDILSMQTGVITAPRGDLYMPNGRYRSEEEDPVVYHLQLFEHLSGLHIPGIIWETELDIIGVPPKIARSAEACLADQLRWLKHVRMPQKAIDMDEDKFRNWIDADVVKRHGEWHEIHGPNDLGIDHEFSMFFGKLVDNITEGLHADDQEDEPGLNLS